MIISLQDDIGYNLVNKLLHYLNKLKDNEKLTVYLNTPGGEISNQELILDVIDKHKDSIELIANGNIFSAGFNVFFKATCSKSINKDTVGMAHFSWTEIEVDQTGKPKSEHGKFLLKEMKRAKKEVLDFLKEIGLTTSELKDVKKGEEVYFTYERLNELLKKQLNG